jgi:hypothetical protein
MTASKRLSAQGLLLAGKSLEITGDRAVKDL